MSKLDDTFICLSIYTTVCLVIVARIGAIMVVFGLGTPLDHPPETTQWVTAWGGRILYYIYIEAVRCQGKVVEWGSRDQNHP